MGRMSRRLRRCLALSIAAVALSTCQEIGFLGTVRDIVYAHNYAWTRVTNSAYWGADRDVKCVVDSDKLWILRNDNNVMLWTQDMADWNEVPAPPLNGRSGFGAAACNGRLFITGGSGNGFPPSYYNDVWSHSAATGWVQENASAGWAGRFGHVSLADSRGIWLSGGHSMDFYTDVWHSDDGISWSKLADSPAFHCLGAAGAVFRNELWITGGNEISDSTNQVWHSPDGATWTKAPSPPWTARSSHTCCVFDNKLWVLGGYGNGPLNDVWYTEDGIDWREFPDTPWSARSALASAAFNGKLYVICGDDGSGTYLSDVWCLEPR
jgi:N-acetylneuraminic acid mutarotase